MFAGYSGYFVTDGIVKKFCCVFSEKKSWNEDMQLISLNRWTCLFILIGRELHQDDWWEILKYLGDCQNSRDREQPLVEFRGYGGQSRVNFNDYWIKTRLDWLESL